MSRTHVMLLTLAVAVAGCDWFEDPTPTEVGLRVDGEAGSSVELVVSTQFLAGQTENGVTQVQLFNADTLVRTLPIDTIVSIAVERRFFTEISPLDVDQAAFRVRVRIDERPLFDESGEILASDPFRYVYAFNQAVTRVIEVF